MAGARKNRDGQADDERPERTAPRGSGNTRRARLVIKEIGEAKLYLGDCKDILPDLEMVDAVVTDPPFGVGNFVQITGILRGKGKNKGVKVKWNNLPPDKEIFKLINDKSKHRIIWGANFFNCFEEKGGAIIWDKQQFMPNFSKADIASCSHLQKTEMIRIKWPNSTFQHKPETDHPCERPVALYEWCIKYLPNPNTILDPFMGSGATGVACINLGKKFIGIEKEKDFFEIACKRISEAERQGDLFNISNSKQIEMIL